MPTYGLIGKPLSHSFSPRYFHDKFQREALTEHSYHLFPISSLEELPDLLAAHKDLRGLNVTIPYKEKILLYLDGISEEAEKIAAVNTLRILSGKLYGYNTDVYGFEQSLRIWLRGEMPRAALVLGTGGASKAIRYVLQRLLIPYLLISRKEEKGDLTYHQVDKKTMQKHPLIINTTPLGMPPYEDSLPPLPYHFLTKHNKLYDLVYNPQKTLFLAKGLERNCATINGLQMLHLQAEASWKIWNSGNLLS
ncbi:MAG TPA: shikimate dehydrogenase [Phaeodactylibacter sp.]|nr:shikimate dehydrogenase [Phaeodactylibacter sp.]